MFKVNSKALNVFLVLALMMVAATQIQGMLTLYVTKVLHLSDNNAYELYAAYGSLIFTMAIMGGFVGGRYISHQGMIVIALFFSTLSLLLCSFPKLEILKCGLCFFIVSSGMIVPNAFSMLGGLYEVGSPQRNTQFTLAYTAMNAGALLSFLVSGYLLSQVSFEAAFRMGSLILLSGTFWVMREYRKNIKPIQLKGVLILLLSLMLSYWLLNHSLVCNYLMIALGGLLVLIIAVLAFRYKKETKNLRALFLLISLAVLFWSSYMLQPTLLTLFVDRNVSHIVLGGVVSTPTLMGLNSFYMIFLGPLFAGLWLYAYEKKWDLEAAHRFFVALFFLGAAFLILYLGVLHANTLGESNPLYVIVFFLFLSVGEMILAPAGYSAMGSLVPPAYQGIMLGAWHLIIGVSASLSGLIAQNSHIQRGEPAVNTNVFYASKFLMVGGGLVIIALVCFVSDAFISKRKGIANASC